MQDVTNKNTNTNGSWWSFTWGNVVNDNPIHNRLQDGSKVVNDNSNINQGFRVGTVKNGNRIDNVEIQLAHVQQEEEREELLG